MDVFCGICTFFITGPPSGPVLFCTLSSSSVGIVFRTHLSSVMHVGVGYVLLGRHLVYVDVIDAVVLLVKCCDGRKDINIWWLVLFTDWQMRWCTCIHWSRGPQDSVWESQYNEILACNVVIYRVLEKKNRALVTVGGIAWEGTQVYNPCHRWKIFLRYSHSLQYYYTWDVCPTRWNDICTYI